MRKILSRSGQIYSPAVEYFYSILMILLCGQILLRSSLFITDYVLTIADGDFINDIAGIYNYLSFLMVIGAFIHFIRIKNWLVIVAASALFLIMLMHVAALNTAIHRTGNFGPVEFLDKMIFWFSVAFALSFMYSDRNRYGWLLFFGLSLALSEILRLVFWESPGLFVKILNFLLLLTSDVMLGMYFWHFWEKKTPFWFLIPAKR